MKKILISLVSIIAGLILLTGNVFAQEDPESVAEKYGVTFPVDELGGCENYSECRTYCEDPLNFDTCISFAKAKGFYEGEEEGEIKTLLSKARTSLGCGTVDECRSYCEQEENFDKCHSFATSNGLTGGYVHDTDSGEFLAKAKEALGCKSYNSCLNFCDNPANRDQCSKFAAEVGARGGYEYKGPGGCSSGTTCSSFCSDPENIEICRQYASSYGGSFSGPGGCTDEASCRSYCEKNPSGCSSYQGPSHDPSEYCSKTPGCSWTGKSCECTSSQTYQGDPATECTKYGCSWNGSWCQCSSDDAQYLERQKTECTKYPGCSWSGSYCNCSTNVNYSSYSSDPVAECTKYSGCTWKDNSCQCGTNPTYTGGGQTPYPYSGGNYTPYPYSTSNYSGTTMTKEQQESTCKSGGGTCQWNGDICNCQGYSSSGGTGSYTPYPTNSGGSGTSSTPAPAPTTASQPQSTTDPAAQCNSYPGCSWSDGGCHCSSVQGIATVYMQTWWQRLLDLVR